jgi:hypothetical protein
MICRHLSHHRSFHDRLGFWPAGDGGGGALFVTASIAWIIAGWMAAQNAILLAIDIYGVWQYWLSPKNRAKIALQKAALDKAEVQGEL